MLLAAAPAPGQSLYTAAFGENADATTGVVTGQTVSFGYLSVLGDGGFALGLGVPTNPDTETGWGSAAGWYDTRFGVTPFGVQLVGGGFAYRDPVLATTNGGISSSLHGYGRKMAGAIELTARAGGRYGYLSGVALSRALAGAGVEAATTAGPFSLRASTDYWIAEEGAYPEITASVVLDLERVRTRAHVTKWLDADIPEAGWGVRTEVGISDRLSATAHFASDAQDILFFSPPRQSWSIGLQLRTGGGDFDAPAIVSAGTTVTLEAPADPAHGAVRVAGTFNDWEPAEMQRRGDRWVLPLRLEPGVYEFAFVAGDGTWFVPEGTPGRKPDGFGGFVGTLVVQ